MGVEADGQCRMGTADAIRAFNADFEAKRSQNPNYAEPPSLPDKGGSRGVGFLKSPLFGDSLAFLANVRLLRKPLIFFFNWR